MVPIKYGTPREGVIHCKKHDQCHPRNECCPWCDSRENDAELKTYLEELDDIANAFQGAFWP